jgi:nicotinate-nucleotide adenylyltransferase
VSAATSTGILGGTFNPPHPGHVALAEHALRQLHLEHVVLIPAALAPHKPAGQDPGSEHRLAMCRLAIDGRPGLSTCALEIERGGPSYTVDTLKDIHATFPEAQLTFIVGADTARTFPTWREPHEILRLAQLAVAERDGEGREQLSEVLGPLRPDARVRFLDMPAVNISSSRVREQAARGERVDELVGPLLGAYIAEQRLYLRPQRADG